MSQLMIPVLLAVSIYMFVATSQGILQQASYQQWPKVLHGINRLTRSRSQQIDHALVRMFPLQSPIVGQRRDQTAEWFHNFLTKYLNGNEETLSLKLRNKLSSLGPQFEKVIVHNGKEGERELVGMSTSMLGWMPVRVVKRNSDEIVVGLEQFGDGDFTRELGLMADDRNESSGESSDDSNQSSGESSDNSNQSSGESSDDSNQSSGESNEDLSEKQDRFTRMPMTFGKRQSKELSQQPGTDLRILPTVAENKDNAAPGEGEGCQSERCHSVDDLLIIINENTDDKDVNTNNEIERAIDQNRDNADIALPQNSLPELRFKFTPKNKNSNGELEMAKQAISRYRKSRERSQDNQRHIEKEDSILARDAKRSVNRMPMYYGKRTPNSKINPTTMNDIFIEYFEMPSTLEKRDDHENHQDLYRMLKSKLASTKGNSNAFVNSRAQQLLDQLLLRGTSLTRLTRSKLERMPINYGKRNGDFLEATDHQHDVSRSRPTMDNSSTSVGTNFNSALGSEGINKRPRLNKMPLTFGKRSDSAGNYQELVKRPRLSKMPMAFGKRSDFAGNYQGLLKRARLSKMPMAFGKRIDFQSNYKEILKRARLNKMPLTFGKRIDFAGNYKELLKRARLSKMPMAFGKRSDFQSNYKEILKRARLNKMPLTFGKRSDFAGNYQELVKRPRLSKMPMAFGKRSDFQSKYKELLKRARLSKMPLAFGKRGDYSSSVQGILKRSRLTKMPMGFGKRLLPTLYSEQFPDLVQTNKETAPGEESGMRSWKVHSEGDTSSNPGASSLVVGSSS